MKILTEIQPASFTRGRVIGLNKHYDEWVSLKTVTATGNTERTVSGNAEGGITENGDQRKIVLKDTLKERFVSRKSAESINQLSEKDFLLRLDDHEFPLWVRGIEALIARHNRGSTNGGFVWKPTTKSFESDLRSLIYKPDDEKKKSLLIDASHVLGERLNWPQYVEKCIGLMLCTSERKPIHEPFKYVLALVHKPSALISEMADGPLGPSIQKLVGG